MERLVVYYSHSGNNRRLALRLAQRIGAHVVEVRPVGWRTFLSILMDSAKNRRPRIKPLPVVPEGIRHIIFVAPVWDMKVANPMVSALEAWAGRIGRYSFATLCGYRRDGQAGALTAQLTDLVGHPPEAVTQAFVGTLVPEKDRMNPLKVSGHRVTEAEMARFQPEIEEIANRLGC